MLGSPITVGQDLSGRTVLTFATFHNPVRVTILYDASFLIEEGNKSIYVDPAKPATLSGLPPADLILVTDVEAGHMDPMAIAAVSTPGTEILAPRAAIQAIGKGHALGNGEITSLFGWFIAAVPLYNLKRGPVAGRVYHQKGRGNGYVLTYGSKSFYVSGATEAVPEMRALKGIDFAFLCMDSQEAMSPDEAADAAKAFHPIIAIPYGYRGGNPRAFAKDLQGTGIVVELFDWYRRVPASPR